MKRDCANKEETEKHNPNIFIYKLLRISEPFFKLLILFNLIILQSNRHKTELFPRSWSLGQSLLLG